MEKLKSSRPLNMQRDSRLHASNINPMASTWQNIADNDEWSAWADDTTALEDQDEFGAWIDSSDPDDSFHSQAPLSSPHVSTEVLAEPSVVTVRQLRRINSLEKDTSAFELGTAPTSSTPVDLAIGLYSNPWNDRDPIVEHPQPQHHHDCDDDCDIDPEIDSALASSAWESVLAEDRCSAHDSDRDSDVEDGDSGTYEAWSFEASRGPVEASYREQRSHKSQAQGIYGQHESSVLQDHHTYADGGLEWYNTDFNEFKETATRSPTLMQRLTGNRRRRKADLLR